MKSKRTPPPLMSKEDRRRLIEAPITFRTYGGCGWGGMSSVDSEDNRIRRYAPGTRAYATRLHTGDTE